MTAFELTSLCGRVWAHPPRAIVGQTIRFLNEALAAKDCSAKVALLLIEDVGAPWFRANLLRRWTRRARWPAGSDLFRVPEHVESHVTWKRAPRVDEPVVLLTSW